MSIVYRRKIKNRNKELYVYKCILKTHVWCLTCCFLPNLLKICHFIVLDIFHFIAVLCDIYHGILRIPVLNKTANGYFFLCQRTCFCAKVTASACFENLFKTYSDTTVNSKFAKTTFIYNFVFDENVKKFWEDKIK